MKDIKDYVLFRDFSKSQLEKLAGVLKERIYEENDLIFSEGDPGDALYIITDGEVSIKRTTDRAKEKYKTIAIIEGGNFFGEMAIFDDKSRSAYAFAKKKSKILVLKKDDFWKIINDEPDSAIDKLLTMNRVMSERLRITNKNFIITFEIAKIMASVHKLGDLSQRIIEHVLFALDKADKCFLAVYNEFSEDFIIESCEKEFSKDDSELIREIFRVRGPVYIENEDDFKKYDNFLKAFSDVKSAMCMPCVWDEKILGILFVISSKENNSFTQSDKLVSMTIAGQIAPAIENLKYREEEENRARLREKRFEY